MPDVSKQLYDGVVRSPIVRMEEACAWIADDYPRKWLRLVNLCEKAMDSGLPRIRRGDLYILAQQQGMPISMCREFRFDNNLWSILSRYLIMFRPELANVIFPRVTEELDDGLDFEAIWHEHVQPLTAFLCDDWQQAVDMFREAA